MSGTVLAEGRLVLAGEIDLQSIDSIHVRLLELAGEPLVEIDCEGVTEVDLSLVQLILAARASARKAGRTVTLAHPATGALRQTLLRGGFIGADTDPPNPDNTFWAQPVGA
jgi:ABC-type transporter Mla MlaB component